MVLIADKKKTAHISSVVSIAPQHAAATTASRASAILDSPSILAIPAKSPQVDEHGSIGACIAETEQIFNNMLKDFVSPTCQFAYSVLRAFRTGLTRLV